MSGHKLTTGSGNVQIGFEAGCNITTGGCNVMIGQLTNASAAGRNLEIVIAAKSSASVGKGQNTAFIDPNGGAVYAGNNNANFSTTSDKRIKKNIVDNTTGLDKINQIQVRNFEYKTPEEITEVPSHAAINKQGIQLGAIAQEIELILPDVVKEESTGVKTVDPSNLTWYMVNAIKELKAQNDSLKSRIETLES